MWFQPSSVVLCMQNSDFKYQTYKSVCRWIDLICGLMHSKERLLGPELHDSMGPRPHLWLCACKTVCLASELLVSMSTSPHRVAFACKTATLWTRNCMSLRVTDLTCRFSACKTACLASELLVSTGPSLHLWFFLMKYNVRAKQRDFWTRMTNLYGSQISPVVFVHAITAWFSTRITCFYKYQPLSVVFAVAHNSAFWHENNKSLWVPDIPCRFVHAKLRALASWITSIYCVPAFICGFWM